MSAVKVVVEGSPRKEIGFSMDGQTDKKKLPFEVEVRAGQTLVVEEKTRQGSWLVAVSGTENTYSATVIDGASGKEISTGRRTLDDIGDTEEWGVEWPNGNLINLRMVNIRKVTLTRI